MSRLATFPTICIALGFPTVEKLLEHAREELFAGESFLEFRLDHLRFPADGVEAIRSLLASRPECRILATCRRHQNHGKFNGSVEEQAAILAAAAAAGAFAVDVEIESAESAPARFDALRHSTKLVVSYHNYDGTPALDAVIRRIARIPADGYKIVTTAHKPSDNLRVLAAAKSHARVPLVMLAMGETGFPTRVLAPTFGGLYTYASPVAAAGTAAGQVSARQLRHLYRLDRFTRAARIYGVIADPVRHSISPAVQNRAFQSRRMDAVFLPFLVESAQLRDFFALADGLPIAGISVTIPHKLRVMRYLDVIDPLARRIGAVNTVWKKAGKWRGANTDAAGVVKPLERRMRLPKASVLLAGNGGAARAAAYALSEAGASVSVTGRNPDRVRALAKACGAKPLLPAEAEAGHFDVLVHATPLGMPPRVDECFFRETIPADIVFDMVYNPLETALLRRAREQKLTVIPGVEMFLEQAAQQFEIWTGESAPRPAMEKAALEILSSGR